MFPFDIQISFLLSPYARGLLEDLAEADGGTDSDFIVKEVERIAKKELATLNVNVCGLIEQGTVTVQEGKAGWFAIVNLTILAPPEERVIEDVKAELEKFSVELSDMRAIVQYVENSYLSECNLKHFEFFATAFPDDLRNDDDTDREHIHTA